MTFPTATPIPELSRRIFITACFNAREGLVTFPTQTPPFPETGVVLEFQCPRGLGDFSHSGSREDEKARQIIRAFQCPRGLGDFSHVVT